MCSTNVEVRWKKRMSKWEWAMNLRGGVIMRATESGEVMNRGAVARERRREER